MASQAAETADVVSTLSEAAGSSSLSASICATRGASAALLAKEVLPSPVPLLFPGGVELCSASQQQPFLD